MNGVRIKFECTNNSNDSSSEYVFCINDNDWERVQSIIYRNICDDEFTYINGTGSFGPLSKITRSNPSNKLCWPNGIDCKDIASMYGKIPCGIETYTNRGMSLIDRLPITMEDIFDKCAKGRRRK